MTQEELYHYGIRGMKWGVRRYQNYDGSYTKQGMARYRQAESAYNTADKKVKTARQAYKSGRGSKSAIKLAKADRSGAKKKLSDAYTQLKKDNAADKGKELYRQGKTITGSNNIKKIGAKKAAAFGALTAVGAAYVKRNYLLIGDNRRLADAALAIGAGTAAVSAAVYGKTVLDDKKMRAYIYHNR